MKLDIEVCRERLQRADHGVLSTVHAERGVDAVPVAFVVDGDIVGIPVDRVKPKSTTRLQRQRNLEADPRAALLVEHWVRDDWTALWWVRAELRYRPSPEDAAACSALLSAKYPQYAHEPFERVLTFVIEAISGWAATASSLQPLDDVSRS